jgi:hypothetical protein
MRGLSYRPGKSWPRNPLPRDPEVVRQHIRAQDRPVSPGSLGL